MSWEWRLGKEWNLVRAGHRVWTQRKGQPLASKGDDLLQRL
eukprot:CAMPEP_0197595958 /NCGR_PEP_ID=MMETSP1326-20131121/24038_1 /TAXON_ID=1155430 /ORGANISM="Genus nov. species nov., Strain RCC2288" /LENGTH=40 /DNA_ID= /DNA_START= /DNA_END= /DNA_ORIENTATION=